MNETETPVVNAGELRQYVYCPRVVYFHTWMPGAAPPTDCMQAGLAAEQKLKQLEKRRKLKRYGLSQGRRSYNVKLVDPVLGLIGIVDMMITASRAVYPIECKLSGPVQPGQTIQVAAYLMMLRNQTQHGTGQGFIYLIEQEQIVTIILTPSVEQQVLSIIESVRCIMKDDLPPRPTSRRGRCKGCEYLHFCADVYETLDRHKPSTDTTCGREFCEEIRSPESSS